MIDQLNFVDLNFYHETTIKIGSHIQGSTQMISFSFLSCFYCLLMLHQRIRNGNKIIVLLFCSSDKGFGLEREAHLNSYGEVAFQGLVQQ